MLPNDNQYYDPNEDDQTEDPTQPASLHPKVVAYLQSLKAQQQARDDANNRAMVQDVGGAGADIASAFFNRPSKQAVYLQHYNDTSAPKMTQSYTPTSNGDQLHKDADTSRAQGVANADRIGKDFDKKSAVDNQVRQQGREDVQDSQTATKFDQNNQDFAHKQARQPGQDAAEDAKNADAQGAYDQNAAHRDPDSDASRGLRDTLSKLSPVVALAVKGQSYDDIAKGPYASLINANEAAESRKQNYAMRHEDKQAQLDDKAVVALKDDLDPNKNRGGNLAKNQAQVDQADRLKGLYTEANGDLRNLDSRQMEELAIGMNKMLSGSSGGSTTQVQALLPHSIVGNAQKLKEWLINDPQGANQQAFVKRMAETVEREREIAGNQVKAAQVARLSGHQKLKQTNPDAYNQVLHAYGIEDADVNNGVYAPKYGGKKDQPAPAQITHGADLP